MSFWYGKPSPVVYHELASFNIIVNLSIECNRFSGMNANANATLKGAVIMMKAQGYNISFNIVNELITRIRIHNIETDKVSVYDIRNLSTRRKGKWYTKLDY